MDKQQYNRIKKLVEKLEEQALKEGIDTLSEDFQVIIQQVLEKKGFTPDDFRVAEKRYEEGEDFSILTKKQQEGLEKKITQEVRDAVSEAMARVQLQVPTAEHIESIAERIAKKYVVPPKVINKIVKEVIRENPKEQTPFADETARQDVEELRKDMIALQLSHVGMSDEMTKEIATIKSGIPQNVITSDVLAPSVKEIVVPELNRILRSFQSQIYSTNKKIDDFSASENLGHHSKFHQL